MTSVLTDPSVASFSDLDARPLTGTVGAEIFGVDVSRPPSPELVAEIKAALLHYHVVFFPDQKLTIDEHIVFARSFGELTRGTAIGPGLADDGYPEVQILDSRTTRAATGGYRDTATWHTDMTFLPTPPGAAVFHAVEVPQAGGDTAFASTVVAYERLSKPLQELCDTLIAIHDWTRMNETLAKTGGGFWDGEPFTHIEPTEHPVVRIHPESGQKSLFLSENRTTHIKGLAKHESAALLRFLYQHIGKPEHVVRYHWRPGSVAFWDNRTVMHRAIDDYPSDVVRVVHRVSLRGERPYGPATIDNN